MRKCLWFLLSFVLGPVWWRQKAGTTAHLGFEIRTIFMSCLLSAAQSNLAPVSKHFHCVFCMSNVFPKCGRRQDRCGHSRHFPRYHYEMALSELKQLITSFSSQRSRFTSGGIQCGICNGQKRSTGRNFSILLWFYVIYHFAIASWPFILGVVNGDVRGHRCSALRNHLHVAL
jgi:hypothetical protein